MAAIKKGDTVKVLTGKAKNETGVVLKVIKASDKVVVEGVNIVKKTPEAFANQPTGRNC